MSTMLTPKSSRSRTAECAPDAPPPMMATSLVMVLTDFLVAAAEAINSAAVLKGHFIVGDSFSVGLWVVADRENLESQISRLKETRGIKN